MFALVPREAGTWQRLAPHGGRTQVLDALNIYYIASDFLIQGR